MTIAEPLLEPDVAPVAVADRKPSLLLKLGYGFGQAIESGYLIAAGFVFFYYTAVLGLSGSAVGTALAISMCIDALIDPFIGSISDNLRTRIGRRLPMMLMGAPLTGLTLVMLFAPPVGLQPVLLFGWLVAAKMLVRGSASLFNLPFAALGAEMTNDYVERASVAAYRIAFGIVVSLAVIFLAYGYFFAGAGGLQVRDHYPAFGIAMAVLFVSCAAVGVASVWRYAVQLPQPRAPGASLAKGLAKGLPEVLRNRSFLSIFLSALLLWVGVGVNGALNNHAYVFVWKLPPQKIQFVGYGFYLGILCGIPVARLILQRLEKKSTIMLGLAVFVGCLTVIQTARALGLLTPTGDAALPWLITNATVGGLGLGLAAVGYPAMIGDAADEHEVKFDARREGLYFAGLGFATKAAAGFGQMAAGFALDGMHFPKVSGAAANSAVPEHMLKLLVLAWGPLAGLFLFGAAVSLAPYGVSRARHGEIVAALKVRRANEARSS